MARRRVAAPSSPAAAAPAELRSLRFADWPGPLLCDVDGRCLINAYGPHVESCGMFSARRRWLEARVDFRAAGGVL